MYNKEERITKALEEIAATLRTLMIFVCIGTGTLLAETWFG